MVAIAVLAGMATAAVTVLAMNWHVPMTREAATGARRAVAGPYAKPSVFGAGSAAPQAPTAMRMTGAQLDESAKSSLVTVTGYDADDQPLTTASGYIHSPNGIIVTSYQAVHGATSIDVETASGQELQVIATMAVSPESDLAILAVAESNLPALHPDATAVVQPGERVFTALGQAGTVTGRRVVGHVDAIQTTLPLAPGAPLFNEYGRVIAVGVVPVRYVSELLAAQHQQD